MTALNPVKTIGDQLIEAIQRHTPARARRPRAGEAIELLQDVEVPYADRRLGDYPAPVLGRHAAARADRDRAREQPDLLVADEPTTALDVTTQAQVLALLERLVTERGTAVILITHNLGVVAEFCDTRLRHVRRAHRRARSGWTHLFARHDPPLQRGPSALACRGPDRFARGPAAGDPRLSRLASPPLPPAARSSRAARSGKSREVCGRMPPPVHALPDGDGGQRPSRVPFRRGAHRAEAAAFHERRGRGGDDPGRRSPRPNASSRCDRLENGPGESPGRRTSSSAPSTASRSTVRRGETLRARRRVGVRQVDPRPLHPPTARAERGPGPVRRRRPAARSGPQELRRTAAPDADRLPGSVRVARPAHDGPRHASPSRWSCTSSATPAERGQRADEMLELVGIDAAQQRAGARTSSRVVSASASGLPARSSLNPDS